MIKVIAIVNGIREARYTFHTKKEAQKFFENYEYPDDGILPKWEVVDEGETLIPV